MLYHTQYTYILYSCYSAKYTEPKLSVVFAGIDASVYTLQHLVNYT